MLITPSYCQDVQVPLVKNFSSRFVTSLVSTFYRKNIKMAYSLTRYTPYYYDPVIVSTYTDEYYRMKDTLRSNQQAVERMIANVREVRWNICTLFFLGGTQIYKIERAIISGFERVRFMLFLPTKKLSDLIIIKTLKSVYLSDVDYIFGWLFCAWLFDSSKDLVSD